MSDRRRLPDRRPQFTGTMVYEGLEYAVSIGLREDSGELAEIFVTGRKEGSHLQRLGNDAAVVVSVALQHGMTAERLAASLGLLPEGSRASVIGAALDFSIGMHADLMPWTPPPRRWRWRGPTP